MFLSIKEGSIYIDKDALDGIRSHVSLLLPYEWYD